MILWALFRNALTLSPVISISIVTLRWKGLAFGRSQFSQIGYTDAGVSKNTNIGSRLPSACSNALSTLVYGTASA